MPLKVSKKHVRATFAAGFSILLASALTACSGTIPYSFPFETASPSCIPGVEDMSQLEIRLSDRSPQANQDFQIHIFKPVDGGDPVELSSGELSELVVSHVAGLTGKDIEIFNSFGTYDSSEGDVITGLGLESPSPSATPIPSVSPSEYASYFPEAYPTDEAGYRATVFREIPNAQLGIDSTFREKVNLPADAMFAGLTSDPWFTSHNIYRFMFPGAIALRCASDAPDQVRAVTPLFVNLVDQLAPQTLVANGDGFTGTMTLPTDRNGIGFNNGIMIARALPASFFSEDYSPAQYYFSFLYEVVGGGDGYSFLPPSGDGPFGLNSAVFTKGEVAYDLSEIKELAPDDYIVVCMFLNNDALTGDGETDGSVFDPTNPDNMLDFVLFKYGYFAIHVGDAGVEDVATIDDSGDLDSVDVIRTSHAKRSHVFAFKVDAAFPEHTSNAGGQTIKLLGENLDLIKQITIGDLNFPVEIANKAAFSFRLPALPAGEYSVSAFDTEGYALNLGSLKVENIKLQARALQVNGFASDSSTLNKAVKKKVAKLSRNAVGYTNAVCVPQVIDNATKTEVSTAKARAEKVCDILKLRNPEIRTKVQKKVQSQSTIQKQVKVKLVYK